MGAVPVQQAPALRRGVQTRLADVDLAAGLHSLLELSPQHIAPPDARRSNRLSIESADGSPRLLDSAFREVKFAPVFVEQSSLHFGAAIGIAAALQ
jgi:hypothetical protein